MHYIDRAKRAQMERTERIAKVRQLTGTNKLATQSGGLNKGRQDETKEDTTNTADPKKGQTTTPPNGNHHRATLSWANIVNGDTDAKNAMRIGIKNALTSLKD